MEHKSKMIYVFDTQSSKNSFEVFSFRKWVHHVHNCWLCSHIRVLDLEANKFGSTVDDFRVQNVNVGMQKSVILGCKINDFGV